MTVGARERLSLIAKDVAEELRRTDDKRRRAAAHAACEFALTRNRLAAPGIEEALQDLRAGRVGSAAARKALQALTDSLDKDYFDLMDVAEDGAADPTVLKAFRRARTANAILFALGSDSFLAATEAAYEAHAATEDLEGLRATVLRAILP